MHGDCFSGATALDIVNAMKMNPFHASRTPLDFMQWMLAGFGQEKFVLPDDEEKAAHLFLQRLTILGYATFELEANENSAEQPVSPVMQISEKASPVSKINMRYIIDY